MRNLSSPSLVCGPLGTSFPGGISPPGAVAADVGPAPLRVRVRAFVWIRAALVLTLFALTLLTGWLGAREGVSPHARGLFTLLLGSLGFGFVTANALRLRLPVEWLALAQVAWDLTFAVSWIYCTGGSGSLFLFLYLFVIIEASFLLDLHGTLLTAFLCALLYWIELHMEYHLVLQPTRAVASAPPVQAPDGYPVANFIFFLFAVCSTAWLTTYLKQRFGKVGVLLQEKAESIRDLLSLNECIVRCVRSGIVTLDAEDRVTSMNDAAVLLTGRDRAEVLGRKVACLFGTLPLREMAQREHDSAVPYRWEQTLSRQDGSALQLGCSGAVLRDHRGSGFGNMIIFQDLTHFKEMEEELKRAERLAAIGELAAGLAHEIRNPLASLYGSIQLLQGELRLQGSMGRLMQIILQESERLNGLISDFLQFASSRVDQRDWLELLPMVEETLALFCQGEDCPAGVELEIDIEAGVSFWANRKQMQQVLWNLLLNAVQAMPAGGRLVIAAAEHAEADGEKQVRLEVRDSGRGIAREDLPRIFDPFFTCRRNGTGLGLAIVHRIVQNHEGRIHVTSEVGKGTAFRIDLPLGAPAASDGVPERRVAGGIR